MGDMIETAVGDIMTTPAHTVVGETKATDAAERLRTRSIGSLVVVDDADEIIGIVVESDLAVLIAERRDPHLPVEAFMSTPVTTIEHTTSIAKAAKRMREHRIKRLPVTDDGDLVGVVTTTDLAYYLPRYRTQIVGE